MKERPIIFSGEMVRAILDGRKTQTRREIKIQPDNDKQQFSTIVSSTVRGESGKHRFVEVENLNIKNHTKSFKCPYGEIGDRFWARETFEMWDDGITYRASNPECDPVAKWKPSIFMARSQSRITLEITNIRVERLNDITEEDALAEGIYKAKSNNPFSGRNYRIAEETHFLEHEDSWFLYARDAFYALWESIKGEGSWEKNPWVWCITFKKI